MSNIPDAFEFLRIIQAGEPDSPFKLATVNPAHSSGRPRVTFDGESTLSVKTYPYLTSYTPAASDRVLMARVGTSYVVVGEVA